MTAEADAFRGAGPAIQAATSDRISSAPTVTKTDPTVYSKWFLLVRG